MRKSELFAQILECVAFETEIAKEQILSKDKFQDVVDAVVCFRGAPHSAVYDRGHLFAAGRELMNDARHVDVVQVCRISRHVYPEYGQV